MRPHEEEYEEQSHEPLETTAVREEEKEGVLCRWFAIKRHAGSSIPGLLVRVWPGPSDKALLFVHGLGGRKEDVVALRGVAEAFGLTMLAVDGRGHGERASAFEGTSLADFLSMLAGTIADNRLAVDVALQNGWAHGGRILLAGVSLGGILGGVIAGVDRRISGAVLYVGGGDLFEIFSKTKHPLVVEMMRDVSEEKVAAVKSQMALVDPLSYVDRISPRPLLLQIGRYDDLVPFETGIRLFQRAKEPKRLVVHDSGHGIPTEKAIEETIAWMKEESRLLWGC